MRGFESTTLTAKRFRAPRSIEKGNAMRTVVPHPLLTVRAPAPDRRSGVKPRWSLLTQKSRPGRTGAAAERGDYSVVDFD